MAKSIFAAPHRQHLLERIARLRPDSPRNFGKMTPAQMICHLEDAVHCATGRTPARFKQTFMANRLVRFLIIYVIPWPKGKAKTVMEMQATKPGDFEADKKRLQAALVEAAERGAGAPWATHPAFGDLSGREYGALIYRHFDFHLKQFNV